MAVEFSEELVKFRIKAELATWLGDGEEGVSAVGGKVLTYQEGNWFYRDEYVGYYRIQGWQVICYNGQPVKSWSYQGGLIEKNVDELIAEQIFQFVKKARRIFLQSFFQQPRKPQSEDLFCLMDGYLTYRRYRTQFSKDDLESIQMETEEVYRDRKKLRQRLELLHQLVFFPADIVGKDE